MLTVDLRSGGVSATLILHIRRNYRFIVTTITSLPLIQARASRLAKEHLYQPPARLPTMLAMLAMLACSSIKVILYGSGNQRLICY